MENLWNQDWNVSVRLLRKRWRVLAAMGAASIVLGTLAIVASFVATLATVVFMGSLVFAGGIVHFIESLNTRGWSGFFGHALATILYSVAGWYMMVHPTVGAASLTLLIGMLLAVGGIYQIVTAVASRYKSWGWALLQGVIAVGLGILIFAQWPVSAMWVIGVFVGIDLLFRGWATLMLAIAAQEAAEILHEPTQAEERRYGIGDRRVAA